MVEYYKLMAILRVLQSYTLLCFHYLLTKFTGLSGLQSLYNIQSL